MSPKTANLESQFRRCSLHHWRTNLCSFTCHITASLCLFSSFSQRNDKHCTNLTTYKWKKCRWCAWDLNPGLQDGRCRWIHWAMAALPHIAPNFVYRMTGIILQWQKGENVHSQMASFSMSFSTQNGALMFPFCSLLPFNRQRDFLSKCFRRRGADVINKL